MPKRFNPIQVVNSIKSKMSQDNKPPRELSPSKQPGSLKRQSSRILGKTSQTSLHSSYTKDSSKESTSSTTQESDTNTTQRTKKPSTTDNTWSIWPRRSSQLESSRPNTTNLTTTSAASIKSGKSAQSEHPPPPPPPPTTSEPAELNQNLSDAESIKPQKDTKEPENKTEERNWMSWRKPSLTSLKKAAAASTSPEPITGDSDTPKSVAHGENTTKPDPGDVKSERAGSWSFWNSTSNSTTIDKKPSLSNVLLSEEAVLFEPSEATEQDKQKASKKQQQKPRIPNQVVPVFETLPYYSTTQSVINNFNNLRYTLGFGVDDPKHLYRLNSTRVKDLKKVLIIGVHGFFPTKVLRPLIGEPTGTSIKFAKEAEKAVLRWAKRENLDITIQKIALEKEGKIFDRVEFFYQVMKKWENDIQNADYIYIAAHSQGCPVSILLLSRLIEDGIIHMESTKKISLLAMAGINNGPFYGADQKLFVRAYSTIENDSLMELFQFQNFDSVHSKEFLDSLKSVVNHNVKITFIGSINDQLVPLYSSTCLHVRHPNIFRATYIDGGSNTPEFVSTAVSLANHLHNIGLSDHGVIKEISNSLAGPLTGGGHSKIYNDPQVYDLALNFSIYTNDLKYMIPLHFKPYSIETLGVNPYHLPWCMRGLLFETKAHIPDGNKEIDQLFEEFENWKPETKQLKDMKYRLNGIKSKL